MAAELTDTDDGNEIEKAIRRQIEFYFGDTNLPTDAFLLSKINTRQGNAAGWVSLDVVMSFKKMKALLRDAFPSAHGNGDDDATADNGPRGDDTDDGRVSTSGERVSNLNLRTRKLQLVEQSCRGSDVVIVSLRYDDDKRGDDDDEATPRTMNAASCSGRIRRKHPLPIVDYVELASRTVIVEGVADPEFSVEGIEAKCGRFLVDEASPVSRTVTGAAETAHSTRDDCVSGSETENGNGVGAGDVVGEKFHKVNMVQLSRGNRGGQGQGSTPTRARSAVQEVLMKRFSDHSSLMASSSSYALVEFETVLGAASCIANLGKANTSWRAGLRCRPLSRQHFNQALGRARAGNAGNASTKKKFTTVEKSNAPAAGATPASSVDRAVAVKISVRDDDANEGDDEASTVGATAAAVVVTITAKTSARKSGKRPKKNYSSWASAASQPQQQQQLGPKRPDGTRGFAMGRGRPPATMTL